MAPLHPPTRSPRPGQSLFLGSVLLTLSVLLLLFITLRWRRRRTESPETQPLLQPMSTSSLCPVLASRLLPPPLPGAILVKSTSLVSPPSSEGRRHSFPLSKSGMAAQKAYASNPALKPAFGPVRFNPSDFDKEGEMEPEVLQRRETIQIFVPPQSDVPGGDRVWKRKTLEFE
jgi:hypothetical protein